MKKRFNDDVGGACTFFWVIQIIIFICTNLAGITSTDSIYILALTGLIIYFVAYLFNK